MSYQISPTWHEWNVYSDDVMQTWFALYVNPSDIMLNLDDLVFMQCEHQ